MNWTLISSDGELADVLGDLAQAPAVAVDTEFMRRNTYYPQIALLQLCAGDRAWLVDPLTLGDPEPLGAFLGDGKSLKLLHSCSEDLEVFRHWLGVVPDTLIDTQRAAALVGEAFGMGYRALVERLLGIELDKGETRSDWLRRPLSQSQCHYAALDVLHLHELWPQLEARATAAKRMDWIVEESRDVVHSQDEREAGLYRRIKGAGRFSRRELEVLRRLVAWREERARASDKPRGWILDDKACLAIARERPAQREALAGLDVVPPSVLRRQGDRLLEIVEEALQTPDGDLPPAFPRPLDGTQRKALKTLRGHAGSLAAEMGVAPEILMTGADLELLVREAEGESIDEPRRWQGWRKPEVLPALRDAARSL
mgnify:CR=1 FL=1